MKERDETRGGWNDESERRVVSERAGKARKAMERREARKPREGSEVKW